MNLKPNPEDNGVITKQFLKKLCKTDFKNYYSTPYLNDILYLHYKGFTRIANLQQYTGLKVIYIQGNAIKKIQGLQTLTNLRCLYLQQNMITSIEGLQNLVDLSNLNLSDNLISKVSGLSTLTKLQNLQLKRNRIGQAGLEDVIGLLECQSISALDISDNKIETEEILPQVLMKMINLGVVYLQNNEFTKKISHYRKTIISKIPSIKYIDDKPVFEDERRYSIAWARGGLQEQRKQRALYKKQEEEKQLRQHEQFRRLIQRYKQEGKRQKQRAESSQSDSQSRSRDESLQTYKSPAESQQNSEKSSQKRAESQSEKDISDNQKVLSEKDHEQKENSERAVSEPQEKKDKMTYLDQLD